MCGIFASTNPDRIPAMLQAMKHRGPDEQRGIVMRDFSIGHARLSIVDTESSGAVQPRRTRKERVVAFNGEIYNYRSLDRGAESEVALIGDMLDQGLDPRQFFDGDYAIIYFDPSSKRVTLYRDRFGMCPLYYCMSKGEVEVSSERRRLLGPARAVPTHGKVVIDLLSRSVVESSFLTHYGITCRSPIEHEELTARALLLDAVASRAKHTDSGFTLALSGGLDSSAVALACTALGLKPAKAITVVAPEDSDDLHFAQLVAEKARIPLSVIKMTMPVIRDEAKGLLEHLDLPRGTLPEPMKWRASLRNWFVAKYAPTRVILCGEGADEMIEGYPPHTSLPVPFQIAAHQLTAIHSLPHINLDRTNKLGLAFSKEFRAPFLASTFSYFLMSLEKRAGKQILRKVLRSLGAPDELLLRGKWGSDERYLDLTLDMIVKGATQ